MENRKPSMKKITSILMTFSLLLLVGSCLIYFGSRNDAVSVAKSLKSGVLMAEDIDVAFQNVGGKLIKKQVQESQLVQKGDVLMVLDDVDTAIAIERTKAVISSQEAQVRQEESAIRIEESDINLTEFATWRKIEETQANLDAAKAEKTLASAEFNRISKLNKSGNASHSMLDSAKSTLTKANMAVVQIERQLASTMLGATQEQIATFRSTKNAEGMTLQSVVNSREKLINRKNVLIQLRAQLAQSQAELKQLEINHQRLTLVAPEAGKILKVLYKEGEMVPTGAPAITLETDRKYVDIYVNEKMVNNYQPGSVINADVPAIAAKVKGIVRFATAASSFSDLRTTRERGQADLVSYQVRIYLEAIPQLLTGMTVEVDDAEHR